MNACHLLLPSTHSPGILGSGCFNKMSRGGALRDAEDKKGPCLLELTFIFPVVQYDMMIEWQHD